MGLFVDTHRSTGEHGGWLRLAGASPQIRRLFGLVALDRLLDFRDNTDAALADV
jgi:anti-anti-sigma regulatory factor